MIKVMLVGSDEMSDVEMRDDGVGGDDIRDVGVTVRVGGYVVGGIW